ncbi:hypothetical protein [Bradyrhizobium centrosematis]|uniref:hypothetical protein n=1 Tax=Bradyrhizobium centrosematis TaxID=1300039 RepID=UPI00216A1EBB|nr:hypothetical protein [Bradyrhizobium centrosematis]MCS3761252.1 hypothetical protein [Bradyrhizobium centrosematis]MCS3770860.1 hypothetical protein [Bradyrhizobium centrosematis]
MKTPSSFRLQSLRPFASRLAATSKRSNAIIIVGLLLQALQGDEAWAMLLWDADPAHVHLED